MHWNEIQGCLVLGFLCPWLSFSLLIFCTAHSLPSHSQADTNTIQIICAFRILNSRPYLSCSCRVVGWWPANKDSSGPLGLTIVFAQFCTFPKILKSMLHCICIKYKITVIHNRKSLFKDQQWPVYTVFFIKAISMINEVYTSKTEVPRDVRNSKSPETRQVQERLVSTLEHIQVPKWDRTRCPGGVRVPCRHATPVADALWKPIFSNNVKFGKKSNQGKVS